MDRPFVKVIDAGGYDFGEPVAQLVKVANSSGLRGHDLRTFIKRAGHQFADAFSRIHLKPGDIPVHLLAVGATEDYGPNRNGDGFKRAVCRRYHDTFRKFAHWYRNHANKDPDKSFGYVPLSAYNDRMHRIELLAVLNGTKEAAERNGGLVAQEELEKLARGEDIPVSMACKVPFDICSSCGNRAKHRGEYCTGVDEGGLCPGGGLMHKIATFIGDSDNPILHADNSEPLFFDISKVVRPADRIAYTSGILKAASTGAVVRGGAAWADYLGVTSPADLEATGETAELINLARKMAEVEMKIASVGVDRWWLSLLKQAALKYPEDAKFGDILQALAMQKIALSLEDFIYLVGRDETKVASAAAQARTYLPGIYNRLLKTGGINVVVENNPFVPAEPLAPLAVRRWAEKQASTHSLSRSSADTRVLRNSISVRSLPDARPVLSADFGSPAAEVAKHYAGYKLAFARSALRDDQDAELTLWLCVAQNYL